MIKFFLRVLTLAYAATGAISTFGYWPTIRDLYNKKRSANLASYVVWTIGTGITFMYSLFILNDWLVRVVTGLNFGCCALIWLLTLRLDMKKKLK